MKSLVRWLGTTLLFLVPSSGLEAQPQSTGWMAFETIDQSALPILRVRLNGSGPYRIVLDVSFNDFVLDTTIVDGSGLKLASQGEIANIEYYGKKERVPVAVLDQLGLGELSFPMVRTLLVEGEDGTGMGGLRSYGRIGRDLLESARLTINYPRRLMLLEPSPEGEVPAGSATFESSGRFLLLPVSLTGASAREVRLVVDAGTSSTVVDRKWAAENGFAVKGATSAVIPSVRVGGFERENLPVLLGAMKELPYGGDAVGVIGADLLLGLSVTYDFSRDLVWLVQVKEESF
jgi:hypothetical protein